MQTFWWSILPAIAAAAMCGFLTPLAGRLAMAMGLVDQPNARKVHKNPVPRVGGVAIYIAAMLAVCAAVALHAFGDGVAASGARDLLFCMIASGFILLLGLADDVFTISSKYKLIGLIAASCALCAAGIRIEGLSFEGTHNFSAGWLSWPLTILFIVGITVSVNFIDGLDGLAGGVMAITAVTLAFVAAQHDQLAVSLAALAIAGSLSGFLFHNWHPARIFMGDSGSMFLGFGLASLTILGARGHGTFSGLVVPILPLTLAIVDTALTFVRRALQRRSIFAAEQGHVHHRLIQIGMCQQHAVMLFYSVSLIASICALLLLFGTMWMKAAGMIAVITMVVAVLRIAESVHLQQTFDAFRRNRKLFQEGKRLQHVFEDQELQFRNVRDFEGWWAQVCKAAAAFDFQEIKLPMTNRDGKMTSRKWCATDGQFNREQVVAAAVPVRQRRIDSALMLEIHLGPSAYLEAASERLTLFTRLIDDHNIAALAGTQQHNPSYRSGPAMSGINIGERRLAGDGISATVFREVGDAEPVAPNTSLPQNASKARIAIVHDFLYTYAGAERVLEQLLELYPNAEVFSLFDFVPAKDRAFLKGKAVTTSFIQKIPFARKCHRLLLPLMPLAIEQLDVADYDIVISSSYLAAKGVITRPGQLHICYCHTPVRIAWDQQNQYLKTVGFSFGLKAMLSRMILHYIRTWDVRSSNGVDVFLTNSDFVGRRISKFYRRKAQTIYPPVAVDNFGLHESKQDFYMTASRLVPYKRVDLIVEAFTATPERRLVVVGDGPELERIKSKAGPNISLVGYQSNEALKRYMQHARAFVFAAEEDFGIVPVEAQACGTPVIACGRGGVSESVIEGRTGTFFYEQTVEAINHAVDRFETMSLNPVDIFDNAQRFSSHRFCEEVSAKVQTEWEKHCADLSGAAAAVERREAAEVTGGVPDEMGLICG